MEDGRREREREEELINLLRQEEAEERRFVEPDPPLAHRRMGQLASAIFADFERLCV